MPSFRPPWKPVNFSTVPEVPPTLPSSCCNIYGCVRSGPVPAKCKSPTSKLWRVHCTPVTVALAVFCSAVLHRSGEVASVLNGSALHARAALQAEAATFLGGSALLVRGVQAIKQAAVLGIAVFLGWATPAIGVAAALSNSTLGRRIASLARAANPSCFALLSRTTLSPCNIRWGRQLLEAAFSCSSGTRTGSSTLILVVDR
mmetsp:Transcript_77677/g.154119  ORF Transcript_77677/g.154119 Transcript_77677/m.154119 type:complete len:202 (-) Transcript_77677:336-941(-)